MKFELDEFLRRTDFNDKTPAEREIKTVAMPDIVVRSMVEKAPEPTFEDIKIMRVRAFDKGLSKGAALCRAACDVPRRTLIQIIAVALASGAIGAMAMHSLRPIPDKVCSEYCSGKNIDLVPGKE